MKSDLEEKLKHAWRSCRQQGISVSPFFSAVPPNDAARNAISHLADLIVESRRLKDALSFIGPATRQMILFAASRDPNEGLSPYR